jgi:hypothetical protein
MFQNEFSAFRFSALASHHLSQAFHQAGLRARVQGCSDDERKRQREIYIEHELLILLLLSIITAYPVFARQLLKILCVVFLFCLIT